MPRQCGTIPSNITSLVEAVQRSAAHFTSMTTDVQPVSQPYYRNNAVGLSRSRVPYPQLTSCYSCLNLSPFSSQLWSTPCRGFETSYRQVQCNTSIDSKTFFPSAIRLWNTSPVDVFQLPPDSLGLN